MKELTTKEGMINRAMIKGAVVVKGALLMMILSHGALWAQSFTKVTTSSLPALTKAGAQWVDFDNDGLLDLFITGVDNLGTYHTAVYTNNGDDTFDKIDLTGLTDVAFAFSDYNKDTYTDIAISGVNSSAEKKTFIYKNSSGTGFIAQSFSLTGLSKGGIIWKDLDQDGDEDLLITGLDDVGDEATMLYEYKSGAYEAVANTLPAVSNGKLKALDLNNDDQLEIIISGLDVNGSAITSVYTIDNNLNTTLYTGDLSGTAFNSISSGDYNEDGFSDLVIAGLSSGSLVKKSLLLKNNQVNGFSSVTSGFQDLSSASADMGDLNNDGLVDVILSGIDDGGIKYFKYYQNSATYSFSDQSHSMPNIYNGDVTIGDYDNDGDLDLFQIGNSDISFQGNIYTSDQGATTVNTAPAVPANLTSEVTADSVYLSWDIATDGLTASNSISYNVYISEEASGATLFVAPLADIASGYLKIPQNGNTGLKNFKSFSKLPEGKYYWSVQAVDNGYQGSAFASEASFVVCYPIDIGADTTICYNEYISLEAGEATDVVNWYSKTNGLLLAGSNTLNHQILSNDTIIAELTKPYSCTVYDTLIVTVSELPNVDLGTDTAICLGEEFSLEVPVSYDSVNWYNMQGLLLANSHTYSFAVQQKDTIIAEIFNEYRCFSYDSIIVDVLSLPDFTLGNDTSICYQQELLFEVSNTWQNVNWHSTQNGLLLSGNHQFLLTVLEKDTIVAEVTDGNGCTNYDSLIVDVLPLPVVDIGIDTAICFNEGILLEAAGNTVNWLTTDHQILEAGTNSYFWEVTEKDTILAQVIDVSNCVNYDSIVIDVLPLPVFDIGSDTALCYQENILLQTGSGFDEVNWYSKSDGSLLQADSWFYNYQVLQTDTLIAEVFSADRCVSYDTIAIGMNPLPVYSLGDDRNICFGDSTTLEVAGSWHEVNWYTEGDLLLEKNKTSFAFKVEESITIWSEVFTAEGCVTYDTIQVNALNLPAFDLGADRSYCLGDSVIFDLPEVGSSFTWTNSNGQTISTDRDYKYVAEASDELFLTVADDNLCEYSDSVNVQVNALPSFEISGSAEICENATNELSIDFNNWQSLIWYNDVDTLFEDEDIISLTLSETTEVFAELTDVNSCKSVSAFEIIVHPLPVADAGDDALICFGDQAVIGGTYDDLTGLQFEWAPAETLDDATVANPTASPEEPVTYTLTVTTAEGCVAVDETYIEVNPEILVEAGENVSICIGDSVMLGGDPTASGSQFGYEYQWMPSSTLSNSTVANPMASPQETTRYDVLVISGKCTVTYDSIEVTVNPLPVIEVISDQSIGAGETVKLNASGGVSYAWAPAQTLDDPTLQTPAASPQKSTKYSVIVTDENGCSTSGEVNVFVQNKFFVPSLFTPNRDGNNDTFKLYGSGIARIELSVFDQTGNRVFHTTSWQEAFETGWDGTYKGNTLKNDIYIWTVDGEFYNGEKVTFEDKNTGIIKLVK